MSPSNLLVLKPDSVILQDEDYVVSIWYRKDLLLTQTKVLSIRKSVSAKSQHGPSSPMLPPGGPITYFYTAVSTAQKIRNFRYRHLPTNSATANRGSM